jgi:hypothetical protein
MNGFIFRSEKKESGRTTYHRLVCAKVSGPRKAISGGAADQEGSGRCYCAAQDKKETIQWCLALSGLEEAVSAVQESSQVIQKAWGVSGDVKRANIEASALSAQQVTFVERLASELLERGLRDRMVAQNAHSALKDSQSLNRLLD